MNRAVYTLMIFGVFLTTSDSVRADFYRWTDAQGNVHVTTDPPVKKKAKVKTIQSEYPVQRSGPRGKTVYQEAGIITGSGAVFTPPSPTTGIENKPASPGLENLQPKGTPTVEIYTAPWCSWCTKTRSFFQGKGVSFREYNIDADPAAAARLKTLNPSGGIPVTVINGQAIAGYSPDRFDAELNR